MKQPGSKHYDLNPFVTVRGCEGGACEGWPAVIKRLRDHPGLRTLVADCYPGVDEAALLEQLQALKPARVFNTADCRLSPQAMLDTLYADQGDDRVFGMMTRKSLADCFDAEKLAAMRRQAQTPCDGLTVVCGVGAGLIAQGDAYAYAQLSRWEIQLRYRRGLPNWGLDNAGEPILTKYKRGFFVLWRIADRHKAARYGMMDYMLDMNDTQTPRLLTGDAFREGLRQAAAQPFRTLPYFDEGVWGGQWIRSKLGVPTDAPNLAWGFDGVPEENALQLRVGALTAQVPCLDLVLYQPRRLLGERVHARFGPEFPIRFDLLDTMGGSNLSLQVHPLTEYIQQEFGMHYTQDESYYILDADMRKDPHVYLGVKTGVDSKAMLADLRHSQQTGDRFPDERYVNRIPVKKHDHLLIPAGTVHCSGAHTMVLEISATPYIFTFKLWDWGHIGLDGLPRPVHIGHGEKNIQWDRDTSYVYDQLVGQQETILSEDGHTAELTGLHEREFIQTIRHTFKRAVACNGKGSVTVLNLVDGEQMTISSPAGAFAPFAVHYAETVIIPAAVGEYLLTPDAGTECKVIAATVRP